jgi:hypothetical protein
MILDEIRSMSTKAMKLSRNGGKRTSIRLLNTKRNIGKPSTI